MNTLTIIYAQLDLHFGLFRSTGAQYSTYKYATKDDKALSNDKSPEAQAIMTASAKSTKWKTIALDDLSDASGIERKVLVRKIDDWNDRGLIELKKEGVQNTYRLEKPLPSTREEIMEIVKYLDAEMEAKEMQNLQRTKDLVNLITGKKCFSRALAEYFSESPDSDGMKEECGHCTWCETHEQVTMPDEPPQPPDPQKVQKILAACSVRDDPKFLAKIAFGIKSPRMSALGIYKSGVFDSMNLCDFKVRLS